MSHARTQWGFADEPDSFDSWADDSKHLLMEVEQQLAGLLTLMKREGIRRDPEGRRLAATLTRYNRVSRLLREQLAKTRVHARRAHATRRLGRERPT